MQALDKEIATARSENYALRFTVPTPQQLSRMRRISDDTAPQSEAARRKLAARFKSLTTGAITVADLSPEERSEMMGLLSPDPNESDT